MSAMVKVSNKTKDAKGVLEQFRLVDVDLEVCGQLLTAGSSVTLPQEDWSLQKRSYERLLKLGALSVEEVKDEEEKTDGKDEKEPGPALVHLDDKKSDDQHSGS